MKIDDPKTPFEDEDPYAAVDSESKPEDNDPIVEAHLQEASLNRDKNAQLYSQ